MEKYLNSVLRNLSEDMNGTSTSLVDEHLFKTRDKAKLTDEQAELFHRVTAQLLFA